MDSGKLIFDESINSKFPFNQYYEQDYYVSSNFLTYRLIENRCCQINKNIYGPKGCGKTHLSNILKKKINSSKSLDVKELDDSVLNNFDKTKCFIIDNYQKNIDEKLFYTILNQSKQYDNYIVVNSTTPLKNMKFKLKDLQSRTNSFVGLGIELQHDLLRNNLQIFFRKTNRY